MTLRKKFCFLVLPALSIYLNLHGIAASCFLHLFSLVCFYALDPALCSSGWSWSISNSLMAYQDASRGYLKLLFLTAAFGSNGHGEAIQRYYNMA